MPSELPINLLKDTTVQALALEDVDTEDITYRYRLTLRVERLAKDIQVNGQQVPIVVRQKSEGSAYQIISGFRRVEALKSLGATTVLAIVANDLSDQEAVKLSIVENEQRKSYTDLERAYAVIRSREQGLTYDKMIPLFNVGERQLRRLKTLTKLPKILQEAISDGSLMSTHALKLHSLAEKYNKFDMKEWMQRTIDENLTIRDLEKAAAADARKTAEKKPMVGIDREGGEVRIAVRKIKLSELDGETKEQMISELEDLLAFLKQS